MGNDSSKPVIGIDLGTEYCCVAAFKNGRVEIIPNNRKNKLTPSYVAFTNEGRLFGEDAKEQTHKNPSNTVFDLKRLIGRRYDDPKLQFDIDKHWPFKVFDDKGKPKIEIIEKGITVSFFPEEITAFLLGYLIETVQNSSVFSGVKPTEAVVSVPAYFNDLQRQETINAFELAGLELLGLISEPTAASLAYVHNDYVLSKGVHAKQTTFVFDLGGGTLDLSIQQLTSGDLRVLAKSGDTRLGGNDFDQRILYHYLEKIPELWSCVFSEDKSALYLLTLESEKAKCHLTINESYNSKFKYQDKFEIDLSLTREEFEELCKDLFVKIRNGLVDFLKHHLKCLELLRLERICLLNTEFRTYCENNLIIDPMVASLIRTLLHPELHELQVEKESYKLIDFVILVGVSSKIPKIKSILEEFFDKEKLISKIDPKEVVAYGASLQAAMIKSAEFRIHTTFESFDFSFKDSLPFSIGIENNHGDIDLIVNKNTEFPIKISKVYTQNLKVEYDHKNIPRILIKVYEENEEKAENNLFIDQLELKNIYVPYKIEISLDIDSRNIIKLKIKDISSIWSNLEASKVLQNLNGRLKNNEIMKARNERQNKLFLDRKRHYNDSREMMSFRELSELFEKSLIKPIMDESILDKIHGLKKPGDKVDISFEFPFTDFSSSSSVKSVEFLKVFNSQAKPKHLRCFPINKEIIFKTGDNLYDDQICMAFLNVFNAIWKHSNLNYTWERSKESTNHQIFNKCYTIVPLGESRMKSGLIEYIDGKPVEDIYDRNTILNKYQHKFNDLINNLRPGGDDYTRLMASVVGTFISIYVLGIGDRHQGNMMVSNDNSFFNIDFGFSFGEIPLIDTADFPIPFFLREYIIKSNNWENFLDQMWKARNALMVYNDLFKYLADKFIKDQLMLARVQKTFKRTLNETMFKGEFRIQVKIGSYAKIPKDIVHQIAKSAK